VIVRLLLRPSGVVLPFASARALGQRSNFLPRFDCVAQQAAPSFLLIRQCFFGFWN
jgi:hypothetical protein